MNDDRNIDSIFNSAIEIESKSERDAYLAEAWGVIPKRLEL
jgi:hypothetical protein